MTFRHRSRNLRAKVGDIQIHAAQEQQQAEGNRYRRHGGL